MGLMKPLWMLEMEVRRKEIVKKREVVIRLVEAQIAGGVDLSPEEMVDAACIMADKIEKSLNGKATE